MRRIVTSSAAAARIAALGEWLGERQTAPEILLLAPSVGAADDVLRDQAAAGLRVFGVHRRTLLQLAHELAAERLAARGFVALTTLSVEALITRSIHLARQEDSLAYFEPVADSPGFPRAAARTVSEIRMQGLGSRDLEGGGPRAENLAQILRHYEAELESHQLSDRVGVLEAACESLAAGPHRLLGLDLALLDVWPEGRRELDLVAALARSAPGLFATLPLADSDAQLRESLAKSLDVVSADIEILVGADEESSLSRARRFLFDVSPRIEEHERDSSLEFFSAPGEARECVEIARRIRGLVGQGVAFDRVAILLREPEGYLPLLQDALRRAGIPAYFSPGTVRPDPAGRAFLALLSCASEGLSASRFAEFLSLGEVAELDESGTLPVREVEWVEPDSDQLVFKTLLPVSEREPQLAESVRAPRSWERLLVDASVVGGRDRWSSRLHGLEQELLLQLHDVEDDEESTKVYLESRISRLRSFRRFVLPVVDHLSDLPSSGTWNEWIESLQTLASRVLRNPDNVVGLLTSLRPMGAVGPVSLEQVRQTLRHRLSVLHDKPPRLRYGRVFVGRIPDALGRCFDSVFVPGLAEGLFPHKVLEDPLLLDLDRVGLDAGLPLKRDRSRNERSLLQWALEAAEVRVVASFPRIDQVLGRSRVPSFYALDLLRAADGRLPALDEIEATHSEATLSWPAPDDRSQAIDDTEYDLATLATLLRAGSKGVRGKGRYLLERRDPKRKDDECLARSLRTRWLRWETRRFNAADGLFDPSQEALEILRDQQLTRRSYSPTALQGLAACPYRFLLQAIHRLRPRDGLVSIEQLDPRTRGSLFHQVQFRFLIAARENNLLPLHEDFQDELLDLVDGALDEVEAEYEDKLAPSIPRIWKSEIEGLRMDLRGWVRKLLDERESWTPAHFEYGFGLPRIVGQERDPRSSQEPAVVMDGARLRGSIDLVDRDWKRQVLRVTDHKTGRAPESGRLVVGGGEILQPILYALAAEDLLVGDGERVESGRLFFCTQKGDYQVVEVELDDESRKAAAEVLELADSMILHGSFPAFPRQHACDYCDYRSVCGPYEELRSAKKDTTPLRRLEGLRGRI